MDPVVTRWGFLMMEGGSLRPQAGVPSNRGTVLKERTGRANTKDRNSVFHGALPVPGLAFNAYSGRYVPCRCVTWGGCGG